MNYIGSKFRLSSWIKDEVIKVVGEDLSQRVFCDMFAGTGIVGRTFKKDVKKVISNDLEHYSFVLNKNYIQNHEEIEDKVKYINELNNLPLVEDGFIYQNYCLGSGSNRQYFSDYNGKKIDTIRKKIQEWSETKKISSNLYYFLLSSLLESADKVANTASVYEAFLKTIKKPALKELELLPANFILNENSHQVFNEDSNELIKKISGDILYLDPPYNHRQYSSKYHILNTISLYDEFTPQGKTGLREYNRSDYSKKRKVHESFKELIANAQFKYIFLSYNNEGLMSEEDVKSIMQKYGKYSLVKKEYKRFKVQLNAQNKTFEYLHILEKV
ncbi:MAG: DNA adenine methylase [Sulfurimonas sp.]|nr:DNA adenine methylase [Sulfurimonas sp.]MCW9067441.1 DNA adenine methylase [Sulfurimonas sp.]